MGVAANYKKPTMLGRSCNDYFRGSIRCQDGTELKDFRQFLLDSKYMEYVEGHASAAGFGIKQSNISKLYEYANEKLKQVDFNQGFYEADFIVNGNTSYLEGMVEELALNGHLWGQKNPEPLIVVENITVPTSKISVIGSNKDTLRFEFNGICYIKFKAADEIEEFNNHARKSNKVNITLVGKPKINRFRGSETLQLIVKDLEFGIATNNTF